MGGAWVHDWMCCCVLVDLILKAKHSHTITPGMFEVDGSLSILTQNNTEGLVKPAVVPVAMEHVVGGVDMIL